MIIMKPKQKFYLMNAVANRSLLLFMQQKLFYIKIVVKKWSWSICNMQ